VKERTDSFFRADLNDEIPEGVGRDFDVILAADVLEHLVNSGVLRGEVKGLLAPGGSAIFCVPNVAHWYPRFRSTLGMFDYDRRGILDATHLRFFIRRSFQKMVARHGYAVGPLDAATMRSTASVMEAATSSGRKSAWSQVRP